MHSCNPEHATHCQLSLMILEVKVEVKMEDEPEAIEGRQQDNHGTEQQREQDGAGHAEQVKVEADRGGHYGRKRPYEESRGYSYYEHREDKRYGHQKL